MESRREFTRHGIGTFVGPADSDSAFYAVDLSRHGMSMLRLARGAPPADHFTVRVPLPGYGRTVHALAETLRVCQRGPLREVAVRFRYIPPDDQRTLDAYLAARSAAA